MSLTSAISFFDKRKYSVVLPVLICCSFCSCRKSDDKKYSEFTDKIATQVRNAVSNQANGTNREMIIAAEGYIWVIKSEASREQYLETSQAGNFLLQLRESGRLPGVSKDEHGEITSDTVPVMISNELVAIVYPMKRTYHIVKEGESTTNNYIVIKQRKDFDWKLQRAWETDSNGQIIKEWPIQ